MKITKIENKGLGMMSAVYRVKDITIFKGWFGGEKKWTINYTEQGTDEGIISEFDSFYDASQYALKLAKFRA